MFTIAKRFSFSAAHHLENLPATHPCSRPHGHNYEVELILAAADLNRVGFVHDYRALDSFKTWLDGTFDHRDLNDVIANPTAELLARHVFDTWSGNIPTLVAVRVSETPRTWAEYRPDARW